MVVRELEPLNISIRSRGWWMDRCVARERCMLLMCCNQKQRHGRRRSDEDTQTTMECVETVRLMRDAHIALVVLDHRLRKCNVIIRKLCLHGHYMRRIVGTTRHMVPHHFVVRISMNGSADVNVICEYETEQKTCIKMTYVTIETKIAIAAAPHRSLSRSTEHRQNDTYKKGRMIFDSSIWFVVCHSSAYRRTEDKCERAQHSSWIQLKCYDATPWTRINSYAFNTFCCDRKKNSSQSEPASTHRRKTRSDRLWRRNFQ